MSNLVKGSKELQAIFSSRSEGVASQYCIKFLCDAKMGMNEYFVRVQMNEEVRQKSSPEQPREQLHHYDEKKHEQNLDIETLTIDDTEEKFHLQSDILIATQAKAQKELTGSDGATYQRSYNLWTYRDNPPTDLSMGSVLLAECGDLIDAATICLKDTTVTTYRELTSTTYVILLITLMR